VAAAAFHGNDALRLLSRAAEAAMAAGDESRAAVDLASSSMLISRAAGIMAEPPTRQEAMRLLEAGRALDDVSPAAVAAVAVADAYQCDEQDEHALGLAGSALAAARASGDATLVIGALDVLVAAQLARGDLANAVVSTRSRVELVPSLPGRARSLFELQDLHLMACDVFLAAGDLFAAADHAEALLQLPFYREDSEHLALARWLKVDAVAGRLECVVKQGESFLVGWERAGRPRASNLASSAYGVAAAHGMQGDAERRAVWLDVTARLLGDRWSLTDCETGWAPTFDAMLHLQRNEPQRALDRMSADPADLDVWGHWHSALWQPWYAALWAEASVLAAAPDPSERLERAAAIAAPNPVAAAIVDRARALAEGRPAELAGIADRFAALGCDYQRERTRELLSLA
jgi:hypothetical protein